MSGSWALVKDGGWYTIYEVDDGDALEIEIKGSTIKITKEAGRK